MQQIHIDPFSWSMLFLGLGFVFMGLYFLAQCLTAYLAARFGTDTPAEESPNGAGYRDDCPKPFQEGQAAA